MLKDFKAFIARGNVIDLAVAVVIGGAFGTIAKSAVDDIIMPPLGLLLGRVDFSNIFTVIKDGSKLAGPYATLADAKGKKPTELAALHHRRARIAGARGAHDEQLAELQVAFGHDKNSGDIAAELADLAEALEQWDLAVRVLRTITLIDGECPISRTSAFLRQAKIAHRRGDRQRAVLWARKAKLFLEEFVHNEDPEIRSALIAHLDLEPRRHPPELRALVLEAARLALEHEDPYVRRRVAGVFGVESERIEHRARYRREIAG